MRNIQIWTCKCGTPYKAISDIDTRAQTPTMSSFTCKVCRAVTEIDGKVVDVQMQPLTSKADSRKK